MRQSRRGFVDVLAGGRSMTRVTTRGSGSPRAGTRTTRRRRRGQARRPRPALPPGVKAIRISSNENPLGPGKAALDAIVGKFPEAGRYPFNSTPTEAHAVATIAAKFKAKPENVVLGAGSQEILKSAMRAFTSPIRAPRDRGADVRELHRQLAQTARASGHRGQGRLAVAARSRGDADGGARAPASSSSTTRTTRRRRCTARKAVTDFVERVRADLAGHGHPDRRGVSRVRDRPGVPDGDSAGARDAERLRRAHVLEGVRHGRHAHRLRDRQAGHGQAAGAAEDAVQHQRRSASPPRSRRSTIRSTSRPSARATPRCARSRSRRSRSWAASRATRRATSSSWTSAGPRPRSATPAPQQGVMRRPRLPAVREDARAHLASARWTR